MKIIMIFFTEINLWWQFNQVWVFFRLHYIYIYIYTFIIIQLCLQYRVPWLSLSHHPSLSSITPGISSRLHPMSAQSWSMSVCAGQPILVCPCVRVHKRTLHMSLSLLLLQCFTCLVCFTSIVWEMGDRGPYDCCFVGCYC